MTTNITIKIVKKREFWSQYYPVVIKDSGMDIKQHPEELRFGAKHEPKINIIMNESI